jgi:hypothetical protein
LQPHEKVIITIVHDDSDATAIDQIATDEIATDGTVQ